MDHPFIVGVVGSRRRNSLHDRKLVFRLICWLYGRERGGSGFSVVSGGCPQGADAFAKECALKLFTPPLSYIEFPIDKKGIETKWEFTQRAYERNRMIAEKASELYCLVSLDRTGGTENTIKHSLQMGKPVFLVLDGGEVYLSKDGALPQCEPVVHLLDLKSTD